MRALVYAAFGAPPEVVDVPEPDCPPDGVLVAVRATGVCRSDWHGWRGHDPDIRPPHVPGHEFAGVVARVGTRVAGARVGDRVTAPFVNACGACVQCREGQQQVCAAQQQPGFTHWGSFAELVAVRHADVNLVALPDGVDFVAAAALGCRFATAYRAVAQHARAAHDPGGARWLVVFGCGGVGLAAVMVAAGHGFRVVAADPSPAARALARQLGAQAEVDAAAPEAPARIRELTGGGAHVTLDAVGRAGTLADAVASLRPRGRHVQVGLLVGPEAGPPVDMSAVLARELEIVGSHGMAAHAYPHLLAEIDAGRLAPGRLVTATIGLDGAARALTGMAQERGPGTTVIVFPRP
ncbi:MAG TPA: alcohol dehydrogenase catalytic domain-containing protein [Pilimelia sp.]|nr:alcohol dehydrogenase catalytic domain-containing protein [Pilimelia sp.]